MPQVALTLAVSSATRERNFSAMRKIKSWVRTSMLQDQFINLSVIYIEKDLTKSTESEDTLNEFSKSSRILVLK
jgi:hypothetical protein